MIDFIIIFNNQLATNTKPNDFTDADQLEAELFADYHFANQTVGADEVCIPCATNIITQELVSSGFFKLLTHSNVCK